MLARSIRLASALAVIVLAVGLAQSGAAPAPAPQVPPGFSVQTIPTGQAAGDLTGFAMVPAGRPGAGSAYTIGKAGKVNWVSADGQTIRTIDRLAVYAHQDIGLIGISVTRDYGTTGRLLVMYTDPAHYAHAAVMRVDDPANPTSWVEEQALISGANPETRVSENSLSHGPGTIAEGPDGFIYIGFGDEARYQDVDPTAYRAQQLDDPHGKVLRVTFTGAAAPGNPYYNPASPNSWRSKVFARGLRNPFRFDFDSRTGRVYLGDVGWMTWEEINVLRGGDNFGWPCYEGVAQTPGYSGLATCQATYAAGTAVTPPLHMWRHTGGGNAAVGGVFYRGTAYPPAYRGRYFFGDYAQQKIYTMATDTNDRITAAPTQFAQGIGAPVRFDTAPNGDIVFADIAGGTLKRLRYGAGNRAPVAVAEATNDPATLTVRVDASASYDLDGDQLRFSTDFGDGSAPVAGAVTQHRYASPGTYPVVVTVTDPSNAVGRQTLRVVPQNHSPTLRLTTPPAGSTFAVGEQVDLSATATDPEDGALPVTWQAVLQHCPEGGGACHAHPDQTLTGPAFSEPFTDHGGDTYIQVVATVTDAAGAVARQEYEARPRLVTIAVSSPVAVTINGFPTSALPVVAGQQVTVAAPAQQQEWAFLNWSDGGAAQHGFPAPNSDVTLTATYRNAIDEKYAQLGGSAAALGGNTGPTVDLGGALAGGRQRPYQRGVIIWSSDNGAHEVRGALYSHYRTDPGLWGFPITDEIAVTGGRASYFDRSRGYWSAATGAWFIRGGNLIKYLQLGGPDGYGLPQTDEVRNADGRGSRQHFSGGRSIFYYPGIGSREVHGGIRTKWASLGWERSRLGYPITDEFDIAGGRRSSFQHGYITWIRATNTITVVYT